jgi:tripeptide aminopeptidase
MVNQDRLINSFIKMVSINSESGDELQFAKYLISLGKSLKLKSRLDSFNNVYIDIPGSGTPLMLNTHMDTVKPGKGIKAHVKDGYISSDGTTVLGADSKASIAAFFEMAIVLLENNRKHRPLQLTFTCNEESGIPTATEIRSDINECVVADRGTPLGEVIYEAPYAQVFELFVQGKTAYATTDFDKGKHAIIAASKIIAKLPLGNFATDATSNIGIINGGIMTTTIPDKCYIKGNCYCFENKDLNLFFDYLEKTVNAVDREIGTKTKVVLLEYFEGFKLSKNDSAVTQAVKSIKAAGLEPKFKRYKAVTNANNLNAIGIKSVLISSGVEFQHTVKEKISIATLTKLTEICINLAS